MHCDFASGCHWELVLFCWPALVGSSFFLVCALLGFLLLCLRLFITHGSCSRRLQNLSEVQVLVPCPWRSMPMVRNFRSRGPVWARCSDALVDAMSRYALMALPSPSRLCEPTSTLRGPLFNNLRIFLASPPFLILPSPRLFPGWCAPKSPRGMLTMTPTA